MTELVTIPLNVEAKGEIIANNFEEFSTKVREALETINEEPSTDEEFGTAAEDVKRLSAVEKLIDGSKEAIISQLEQMNVLFTDMDGLTDDVKNVRLDLSKKIEVEKAKRRDAMVAEAVERVDLEAGWRESHATNRIKDAIKGKRSLKSMVEAIDREIILINSEIEKTDEVINQFTAEHGQDLASDWRALRCKSADVVSAELQGRADAAKARQAQEEAEAEAKKVKEQLQQTEVEATPSTDPVADELPNVTQPDEWEAYMTKVRTAFAPMKAARESLIHEANQKRAAAFAEKLNAAWRELKV